MKRLLVIIALVGLGVAYIVTANDKEKLHYQKELEKRAQMISKLRDSVQIYSDRAEIYEITFDYLREVDSTMVDNAMHHLWNIIENEE